MENTIVFYVFLRMKHIMYLCSSYHQHINYMTKETRTDVQIYSAIAMLVAGVGLATAGFIVPPTGEIWHPSHAEPLALHRLS